MKFSKKSILKLLIVCSLLYLSFTLIISTFFGRNECLSTHCTDSSGEEFTENESKITLILIEFEFFDNDLTETLRSVCRLSAMNAILVVSQKPIYPPIERNGLLAECHIRFIVCSFQLNQSLADSHIESHITGHYVLVIPDAVRLESRRLLLDSIQHLNRLNAIERTALLLPIGPNGSQTNDCFQIEFDIKRWTLRYSRRQSSDSCDAFGGHDYAVLMRRTDLLELNRPFVRPFIESFLIQSKLNSIKVKLFANRLINSGRRLFAENERNKWKHKLWTEERRKSLFDVLGVKKLVDADGSVHWFGCSKHTTRCFGTVVDEMPDFLFANRWTPVCCIENLAKTGRYVFEVLESYGVRYWLEGGSLLGAARDGQIIPWDYDIDVGVYREDMKKCHYFEQKSPFVDEKGFVWEKALEGDFHRVHFSQTNRLHVDIFPFDSRNGTMTKKTWFESHIQDREFPEHYLKPLTRIRFVGTLAFAPNNVNQFLEFKFNDTNVIRSPKYPNPELLQFPNKDLVY